ncbi:primosomal protein N' [Actinomyces vulturis]|uniref:primosomal protein N' family DNA-binding protein n=1 Tax=Actinomyces vulturis TaxID=1857645 RepID=UPI00159EC633|nr:primosomal protein N' [Actinomyces vulturis]
MSPRTADRAALPLEHNSLPPSADTPTAMDIRTLAVPDIRSGEYTLSQVSSEHTAGFDLFGARDDDMPLLGHAHSVTPAQARGVTKPIARVLVDAPVPHMARSFDYLVPPTMDADAQPGVRVVVRLGSHKNLDGWILKRDSLTTHIGTLIDLTRVVSPLPVLTPNLLDLAQAVAQRCACTIPDVLRLAIPPRHARVEKTFLPIRTCDLPVSNTSILGRDITSEKLSATPEGSQSLETFAHYDGGHEFFSALSNSWICHRDSEQSDHTVRTPRGVWTWVPDHQGDNPTPWHALFALIKQAHQHGKSVLVLLPTTRQAITFLDGARQHCPDVPATLMTSNQGHSERYQAYCAALSGQVTLIVGTRSAAYAPMVNPGLMMMLDDVSSHYVEQRSPYAHTRTVLSLRSTHEHIPLLIAGLTRSVETQAWVEAGWAQSISAPRPLKRKHLAKVQAPTYEDLEAEGASGHARIPSRALSLIRRAVTSGPVLVQVAHSVARPILVCARCRAHAHCTVCQSVITPLRTSGRKHLNTSQQPESLGCVLAEHPYIPQPCWRCGSTAYRVIGGGAIRTADELARSLPKISVMYSTTPNGDDSIDTIDHTPRVVVATAGNEPIAKNGYRGVVILDAWSLSSRPHLNSGTLALATWSKAISLAHPDAPVLLLGDPDPTLAATLVRWDMEGYAHRELDERRELHLPPLWRTARIEGSRTALQSVTQSIRSAIAADHPTELLGPFPSETGDETRWVCVVRTPAAFGKDLTTMLRSLSVTRSAHRLEPVKINCDPATLW